MPLNVPARQRCLRNLKCAYTGREIEVRMFEDPAGRAWFFSPDAYDPARDPSPDSVALFSALSCRDGIRGAARNGAELVCPYTGARMRPVHDATGYYATGGFSPSTPVRGPEAFARLMLTRGGTVPADAPKIPAAPVSIAARPVEEVEVPESGRDLTALADDVADRACAGGKTTVVNPGLPGRRRRKG